MNAIEKLTSIQDELQTGDIILCCGSSILSKLIRYFTRSPFSHSAVILKKDNQLFVIQSTINKKADGVEIYPLTQELTGDLDFCIKRPKRSAEQIQAAIIGMKQKIKEHYTYNILFYVQFLLYYYFKWDDTHITQKHAYVCSQAVQFFTDELNIPQFAAIKLIVPATFYTTSCNDLELIIDINKT